MSVQYDHHLPASFTGFHDAVGFPDVVEGKDAGRSGVELAVLHLFGDVAQWYVRQRETGCAEYKAAEKSQMHAAGHPQKWIEVRYGCESTQPACQARAPAAAQHIQGVEDRAVAHQVEDGIDLLGLGDARGQVRRLDLGAAAPSAVSIANWSGLRLVAITRAPRRMASLTAAWPNDEVAPRMTMVWPAANSRLRNRHVQAVA